MRREGGREGVRWGGKEAEPWLFTSGLSSLSCHRSSEMGDSQTAPLQFHLAPDQAETPKNEKIKTAILQCPEKSERIIHAQRNLTALSQRQHQQKNIRGFSNKDTLSIRPRFLFFSKLHCARLLLVMKYFLWTLDVLKKGQKVSKRSTWTIWAGQTYHEIMKVVSPIEQGCTSHTSIKTPR